MSIVQANEEELTSFPLERKQNKSKRSIYNSCINIKNIKMNRCLSNQTRWNEIHIHVSSLL